MNRETFNAWKKKNPYHVWVTDTTNGRRVLHHYKDRAEALRVNKNSAFEVGKQTTAASARPQTRKKRPSNPFEFKW